MENERPSDSVIHPSERSDSAAPLATRRCTACDASTPRLTAAAAENLVRELDDWTINDAGHLVRSWRTRDFLTALDLVNRIAAIAEEENHHPEIRFGWGHLEVELWTHAIHGLSENDFILAARIDQLTR